MSFQLCKQTGALCTSVDHEDYDYWCNVHQSPECVQTYVPWDEEWSTLRRQRDDAKQAAEIAVRALRKARREVDDAVRSVTQPRQRFVGVLPPLVDVGQMDNGDGDAD